MNDEQQGNDRDDSQDSQPTRPVTRSRPKNPKELFYDALPMRAKEAGTVLRSHLTGKTGFILPDTKQEFLIDWTSNDCIIKDKLTDTVDCKITISSTDVMRIAAGDLNAQIAMLSSRISIEGRADCAVYVFNLIAPYSN